MTDLVPMESITGKILLLRGMNIILDRDLAEFYRWNQSIETGRQEKHQTLFRRFHV